ncbi:hypothetical protein BO71DRAFT_146620 [Aspergillus ellipticus CBS 707.79]|uniref:Uncharacterized protein n=1 Tax=Aspergillus ellipticus CBS 707.79 TaxID=1448320 RepID=A0A319DIM6_9EURO|nr:hypothetical protein BO71DRAFT_146620 [Aspergillus ellipticus CBS 707.79]
MTTSTQTIATGTPPHRRKHLSSLSSEKSFVSDEETMAESDSEPEPDSSPQRRQPVATVQRRQAASGDRAMRRARQGQGQQALQPYRRSESNPAPGDQSLSSIRGGRDLQTQGESSVEQEGQEEEQDGLKLRLDLNLDIEVELKARIQGDITLSLL